MFVLEVVETLHNNKKRGLLKATKGKPNGGMKRHGSGLNDVALYRAYCMPTGKVDTLLTTMRLTANPIDGNRLFGEDGGNDQVAPASGHLIERLRNFICKDNVKAFLLMRDFWK